MKIRVLFNAILILMGVFFLLLLYSRWIEPDWLQVHTVEIEIAGLDPRLDGFTILHLSDLHQHRFGQAQEKLLRALDQEHYDMVALTGDVLNYPVSYDFSPTGELLAGLKAPVFFVYGNHDYPGYEALTRELTEAGVSIMANSWQELKIGSAVIQLAGIHDMYWTKHNPGSWLKTDLDKALQGTDPAKLTLLLSHSPAILDAAADRKISLILCGHTHGGQIKIPLLGAPSTGSGKSFDKYVQGLYSAGTTQLYINRGLGTSTYPLRFLSRPEVVFIRLKGAD